MTDLRYEIFNSCNSLPHLLLERWNALVPKFNFARLVTTASFNFLISNQVNWSAAIETFPSKNLYNFNFAKGVYGEVLLARKFSDCDSAILKFILKKILLSMFHLVVKWQDLHIYSRKFIAFNHGKRFL